ncbi:VCBS domain-containing protein [Pseudodesulfovibrio methanolicus]|uniref:VCBS domain-containing protein n=1 Tax=Pseudodesulfovibrio methanolicus TaxID=3126690 RepID=A0ABZ2ITB3_9BACT
MTATSTTQAPVIQVSLPGAGRSVSYRLTPDALVRFTFDLADAEFIGNGNNLELVVEDGGTIILQDYLPLAEANTLPVFEMLDGQQVEGGVYLFAFEGNQPVTEQDIETAAAGATSGSGAGEYTDDPGTLFDGLNALGPQVDAYDGHLFPTIDPIVTDLPEAAAIPPVAVGDVSRIVESGTNRSGGENGHYDAGQGLFSSVTGNLLLNDYDDDNVDYPETGGADTELSVLTIDFPGQDFTGNNPGPEEVSGTGTQVNGQYGTLTVHADGSYEYALDETLADPLREGQEVTEQFLYTAVAPDGNESNTATLTITVVGTNDPPEALDDVSADVVEQGSEVAGIAIAAGNVLHNDADIDNVGYEDLAPAYKDQLPTDPDGLIELGVTSIYSYGTSQYAGTPDGNGNFTVNGTYGTLTINADGAYEYALDQDKADPLNIGDNPTEDFGYSMWDGEKYDYAYLRIPVLGSNDAPVADADVNAFTEAVDDAAPADVLGAVLANDTDVDNTAAELSVADIRYSGDGTPPVRVSEAYTADHVIEGRYGTLYLNNDGTYHYVEDKTATDPLNTNNAAVTDVFTYDVTDNQAGGALSDTATLTITIDPANDSPVAVHDGSHGIFITNTVETVIDDWSGVSGSVIYRPGYTVTAESFDANGDPINDVQFTTWGNDQHLGIHTNGTSDSQKVDDLDGREQITFEFDDPQSSFSTEFIAQGNNHVNAWVYPIGGGVPVMFENVGNAVHITPGFDFDTIVFIPDGSFGMESLTTVTGGENLLMGTAGGNVLANDYDVDNVTFDDATASGDMGAMELSVSDIDSGNVPGNAPSTGTDLDGDYYTVDGEFGSLKIYETGEWSYTPHEAVGGEGGWQNLDHSATDTFVYTVSDGLGGTDTAAIEVSLNVNTTSATGGTGTLSGTDGSDVLFPADGDSVSSGAGNDVIVIVIDPVYLGGGAATIDVTDFSDHDRLALGNMEGASVAITSNSNDVSLVFSDIDGSDDITVNLLGVAPVHDAVDQTVGITSSADLNQLIQTIIDSGNASMA